MNSQFNDSILRNRKIVLEEIIKKQVSLYIDQLIYAYQQYNIVVHISFNCHLFQYKIINQSALFLSQFFKHSTTKFINFLNVFHRFFINNIKYKYNFHMIEESENIQRIKIKLRKQELISKDKSIRQQCSEKSDDIFKIADKALWVINKTIGLNIDLVEMVLRVLKNDVKSQFQIVHQTHELEKIKILEHRNYKEWKNIFMNLNVENNIQEINLIIRFYVRLSQKLYSKFMVYAKNKKYLKFISFNYLQLFNFRQQLNKFQNVQNFVFFCEIIQFIIQQNELLFDFLLSLIINNELVTSIEQYYKMAQKNNIIIDQQNQNQEFKQQLLSITKKFQLTDQNDFRNYYQFKKGNYSSKKKKSIQEIINNLTSSLQKTQQKTYLKFRTRISIQKELLNNVDKNSQSHHEIKETNEQLQSVRKQLMRISQTLKQKTVLIDQLNRGFSGNKLEKIQDPKIIENLVSINKKNNIEKNKKFRIKKQNVSNLITINQAQLTKEKYLKNKGFFIISPNHANKTKNIFQKPQINVEFTIKKLFQDTLQKQIKNQKKQNRKNHLQQNQQKIKSINVINRMANTLYVPKNRNLMTQSSHSHEHKLIFEKYKQFLEPLLPCFTQQNNLIKKNKEIIFSEVKDLEQSKENFFQNSNSCRIKCNQQEIEHLTSKYNYKNNRKWTQPNHKIFEIFNPRQSKLYK